MKKFLSMLLVSLMLLAPPASAYVEHWLADSYQGYEVVITMNDGTTYEGQVMGVPSKVLLWDFETQQIVVVSRTHMSSIRLKRNEEGK